MREAINQLIDAALNNASDATGRNLMRGFQGIHRAGKLLFRRNDADQRLERNNARCSDSANVPDVQTIMTRGFMHGQRLSPQNHLEIGETGTGGANGCGPIAVYNAIYQLNGQRNAPNPAEIIYALERDGAFNLGGLAGTNPEAMVTYLREIGRKAEISYLPSNLDASISAAGVTILLYSGGGAYIHYVMVRYVAGGNAAGTQRGESQFLIYNRGSNDQNHVATSSVDQWAATGLNGTPYRPLALITVA
ncbi:MAG: hypothetical protein FWC91_12230 [Defluviitaleaceae bacterium]|nr:hypothetical protein [Defluviitaleaceae bacterium]